MTDVRSLLKNERATRRIDHPQAFYTATGTLECIICKLPIKSDTEVWNKHLKSPQHAMRAERARVSTKQPSETSTQTIAAGPSQDLANGSKKRKADDDEDQEDTRKRTRPEDEDSSRSTARKVSFDEPPGDETKSSHKRVEIARPSPVQVTAAPPPPPPLQASQDPVNEDEWAAFEATLARSTSPSPPPDTAAATALTAATTISAAPLTAAQLAAQSREESSLQSKERREAEVEAEKEDAARQLEEEFDEMEALEERVRKLREQREQLRLTSAEGNDRGDVQGKGVEEPIEGASTEAGPALEQEGESESGEDDDMWGAWGRH